MKKKKFWTSEKIVSLSAILISLLTFISIVYQNRLLQKHQSASVLPYLEIWNSQSADRYELILMNNGIGPAFIRDFRVVYEGETHDMDPFTFFMEVIKPADSLVRDVYYSNLSEGRLIPAGNHFELIGIKDSKVPADFLRKLFGDSEIAKVEIEFESVYGERWMTSGLGGKEPVRIN